MLASLQHYKAHCKLAQLRRNKAGEIILLLLPPATKLGQGYIFTGVCDSVHMGGAWSGGCMVLGDAWSGGCLVQGVHGPRGVPGGDPPAPEMATAAGGTHPTGMHSCLYFTSIRSSSTIPFKSISFKTLSSI